MDDRRRPSNARWLKDRPVRQPDFRASEPRQAVLDGPDAGGLGFLVADALLQVLNVGRKAIRQREPLQLHQLLGSGLFPRRMLARFSNHGQFPPRQLVGLLRSDVGDAAQGEPTNPRRASDHDFVSGAGGAHVEAKARWRALIAVQDAVRLPDVFGQSRGDDYPSLLAFDRASRHAQLADLPVGKLKLGASAARGRNNRIHGRSAVCPSQHRFDPL